MDQFQMDCSFVTNATIGLAVIRLTCFSERSKIIATTCGKKAVQRQADGRTDLANGKAEVQ